MTTLAPCPANARTTALPMPVLPPVTMATLPASSSAMSNLRPRADDGAVSPDRWSYATEPFDCREVDGRLRALSTPAFTLSSPVPWRDHPQVTGPGPLALEAGTPVP